MRPSLSTLDAALPAFGLVFSFFATDFLLADLLASVQTRAVSFYRKLHRCKSVPRLPSGHETLRGPGAPSLGASAIDFWRWAFADLKQNALRGVFAELCSPEKSP